MRMRSSDKIVMVVLLLLLILLSLFCIAFSFNAFSYNGLRAFLDTMYTNIWLRVLLSIVALGIIFLCGKVLFSRDSVEHSATEALRVHMTNAGSITISEQAIVQMVRVVVMSYPQVGDVTVQLAEEEEKLQIRLYIVLSSDSVIPEVIADMQSKVIGYIEEHAGLRPGSVAVFVDTDANAHSHKTAHIPFKETKVEEEPVTVSEDTPDLTPENEDVDSSEEQTDAPIVLGAISEEDNDQI